MEKSISMCDLSRLLDYDCDDEQLVDFFAKRRLPRRQAFDINGISNLQLDVQFERINSPKEKTQTKDDDFSLQNTNAESNQINSPPITIEPNVVSPKRITKSPHRSLSRSGGPVLQRSLRRVSLHRLSKLNTRRTLLKELEQSDFTAGFEPPVFSTPMSNSQKNIPSTENNKNQSNIEKENASICSTKDANRSLSKQSNIENDGQLENMPISRMQNNQKLCTSATRYEVVDMEESARDSLRQSRTTTNTSPLDKQNKTKMLKTAHVSPALAETRKSPMAPVSDFNDCSDIEIPETQEQQIEEEKGESVEEQIVQIETEEQKEKTMLKSSLANATRFKSIRNVQSLLMEVENEVMPEDVSLCVTENEGDCEWSVHQSDKEAADSPLNLAGERCKTLRSRNLRSQQTRRRVVPLDESEILSKKHKIGPPLAHVASSSNKGNVRTKPSRIPLNSAPRTPINGELFAAELKEQIARRIKYDTLDLRKRKSSVKSALSQSNLVGKNTQISEEPATDRQEEQKKRSSPVMAVEDQQRESQTVQLVNETEKVVCRSHVSTNPTQDEQASYSTPKSVQLRLQNALSRVESRILETSRQLNTSLPMETVIPAPPAYQNDEPAKEVANIELDAFVDGDDGDIVTFSQPEPPKKSPCKRPKQQVPEVMKKYLNVSKELTEKKKKWTMSFKRSLYSKGQSDDEISLADKNESSSFRIHRNPLIISPPSPFSESSTAAKTKSNRTDTEESSTNPALTSENVLPVDEQEIDANKGNTTQRQSASTSTTSIEQHIFKMPKVPPIKPKSKNQSKKSQSKQNTSKHNGSKNKSKSSAMPEKDCHTMIEQHSDDSEPASLRRSKRTPTPAKRPMIDILFAKQMCKAMEAIQKRKSLKTKLAKSKSSRSQSKDSFNSFNPLGESTESTAVSSFGGDSSVQSEYPASATKQRTTLETIREEPVCSNNRKAKENAKKLQLKRNKKVHTNSTTSQKVVVVTTNSDEIFDRLKSGSDLGCEPIDYNEVVPQPTSTTLEVPEKNVDASSQQTVEKCDDSSSNRTAEKLDDTLPKRTAKERFDSSSQQSVEKCIDSSPTQTAEKCVDSSSKRTAKNRVVSSQTAIKLPKSSKKKAKKNIEVKKTELTTVLEDKEIEEELPTCSNAVVESVEPTELPQSIHPSTDHSSNFKIRKLQVRVKRCPLPEKAQPQTQPAEIETEEPVQENPPSVIMEEQTKDLVSWLKNVPNIGLDRLEPVSVDICSFATKDLYFTEKGGIEYAFYNGDSDSNLGYIRFKPRQIKKQSRTKLFTLHFITLSEKFKFTTNVGEMICNSGSMMCVQKGTCYKIENLSDDIGLLLCIRS